MDAPGDDPDLEQVRSLLRSQYGELGPKRPGWVGRLAERFRPEPKPAVWVEHAVSEVAEPAASSVLGPAAISPAPDLGARDDRNPPQHPPRSEPEPLGAILGRLSQLTAELGELAGAARGG